MIPITDGRTRDVINALRINQADNALVALAPIHAGQSVSAAGQKKELFALTEIPERHKVAACRIEGGEKVILYGHSIGKAKQTVEPGDYLHDHNIESELDADNNLGSLALLPFTKPPELPGELPKEFLGFRRADGSVGIRNEIWILPLVGCVAQTCDRIAARARVELAPGLAGIDGIFSFSHQFGCSQLGDDLQNTAKLLAGLARNPNAAGILFVGLGCENLTIDIIKKHLPPESGERFCFLLAQEVDDEEVAGVELVRKLAVAASSVRRQSCPLADLTIAVKCGSSDGFSGITANPVCGAAADLFVMAGASVLISELPEMFGAEAAFFPRAANAEILAQLVELAQRMREYFRLRGQPIDKNPSPGNIAAGISTLAQKSLGAIQKAGTRGRIEQVLDYGLSAQRALGGLAVVEAPGNDEVSVTALAAAGANLVIFTTGGGTPWGGCVPTLKVASNSELFRRKGGSWIDFNAGGVICDPSPGDDPIVERGTDLFRYVVDVANGVPVCCEVRNERKIAVWHTGVTV